MLLFIPTYYCKEKYIIICNLEWIQLVLEKILLRCSLVQVDTVSLFRYYLLLIVCDIYSFNNKVILFLLFATTSSLPYFLSSYYYYSSHYFTTLGPTIYYICLYSGNVVGTVLRLAEKTVLNGVKWVAQSVIPIYFYKQDFSL